MKSREAHRIRKEHGVVVRHVSSASDDLIDLLITDPDRLVQDGIMVKNGDRTTIVRYVHDGTSYLLKRYNCKGRFHTAVHLMLRSRAAWSWRNALRLTGTGVRTPAVVAMLEERRGPLRLRSFLLTEWIESTPLNEWVGIADDARMNHIAQQFANIWNTLGENHLGHGDMKATNFLIDSGDHMWLIDLDGMRSHLPGPALARVRRRDLARFFRNWQDQPEVLATFRAHLDTAEPHGV